MTDEPTVTTGEIVSEPDTSGEWLTPPKAADRLGVSERTLWRYVDQGKYHKRVVNRRAEILVPDSGATSATREETALTVTTDTPATTPGSAEVVALVSRQAQTVTRQAVQITRQAGEIKRLRDEAAEQAEALDAARREISKVPGWLRRWFGVSE